MVKTDDYILMEDGGGGAGNFNIVNTTAAFMQKMEMVAKNGFGSGVGAGTNTGMVGKREGQQLMLMELDQQCAAIRRADWLSARSKSDATNNCSADFDESDESGGADNHRMLVDDAKAGDRTKFTPSIDSELDDRRMRRQIANCNERRRMQSINAGFQALRQLLPRKDGDKMSKAAILATTADFIQSLLHEKVKLIEENSMAMSKKRRLDIEDQKMTEELSHPTVLECLRTIGELRNSLQKETQLRMVYEKELLELRCKVRQSVVDSSSSLSSPLADFCSPNSSANSLAFLSPTTNGSNGGNNNNGDGGLLIELAKQHENSGVYRPTPIIPSDVQLLTNAIASLAQKASPVSSGSNVPQGTTGFLQQLNGGNPIGIHHHGKSNNKSLFVSTTATSSNNEAGGMRTHQQYPLNNGNLLLGVAHQTQLGHNPPSMGIVKNGEIGMVAERKMSEPANFGANDRNSEETTTAAVAAQYPTISQRNLQALMLAIHHLEGASSSSSSSNDLLVQ